MRNTHRLHPHEHHASRDRIINQLGCPQRHSEPVCKNLCAAIDVPAHADHDSQAIDHKYDPAEHLLRRAMEQFALKAFDQLYAAVVIGELCNNQMQDHIGDIGEGNHPDNMQQAVPRCQIGHGNDPGSDTVSHQHTNRFKCRQLCL